MKQQQSGFTLIEIAIVLVIIGLLLGGILQGQEMIRSGRIKNMVNTMEGAGAAFYAYQDRFKAIPGDNVNAAAQHGGAACPGAACGNGIINGNWDVAGGAESSVAWEHLRTAGFVNGSGETQPTHALGGQMGFTGDQTLHTVTNVNRIVIGNVAGEFASVIDLEIDDGFADGGRILGANLAANLATAYGLAVNYATVTWQY